MFDDGSFVHGVNKSNPFETILSYHVLLYNKSYPIKQSQTLPIEIEVIIVFLVFFLHGNTWHGQQKQREALLRHDFSLDGNLSPYLESLWGAANENFILKEHKCFMMDGWAIE